MDHIPIGQRRPGDDGGNVVPLRSSPSDDDPAPTAETEGEEHVDRDTPALDEEDVSYEEALAADAAVVEDDEPDDAIPGSGVATLLEQSVRVGAGLFSAGASALADALRSSIPGDTDDDAKDPAAVLAGAGLGAAVTAAEAAASAATSAADTIAPLVSWAINPRFAKDAAEMTAGAARVLDGEWKAAQAETVKAASAFLSTLVPEIVSSLFDQIDVTQLVRDRVDLNAIVEDVDVERLLDRIDIDAIVSRVDVDAIVARVDMERVARSFPVDEVLDGIDLDQVVDRVDIDRAVERVDLDAIVHRMNLGEIAQEVIDEIDLPAIVRESSGVMASEGIQTVRVQGMNADRLVSRIVDRVLRRDARDLGAPADPERGDR
jgi:hypothetical protein